MDLFRVCSNYVVWAQNGTAPGSHMFYIDLYRENRKKSCLKTRDLDLGIWSVASPSGPRAHGVKNGTALGVTWFV